jgi:protein phosphatase methylesterase 1
MDKVLRSRPASFKSLDAGVHWALRSGMVKNKAAAQVSLPSQLVERIDAAGKQEFVWRTDLKRSQPHWEGEMVFTFGYV